MHRIVAFGAMSWSVCSVANAIPPVTLSSPTPPLATTYRANSTTLVTYTINNNVPKSLPISVSGISDAIQRTTVANDCNNILPIGPSACHIGLMINPSNLQKGTVINQILQIDYQGRAPLTSLISFNVPQAFAYVTPALYATSIHQFSLSNDGTLLSYTTAHTASNTEHFGQMTFANVNGIDRAYILDPDGAVYWCNINIDGSFSNCMIASSLPPLGTWQARGIAFATFNALYAYIVDPGNNIVYQCSVAATGDFYNCLQQPSPHNLPTLAPYGIAFATTNGNQYAYIADAGSGSGFGNILFCPMHSDGSFTNNCVQTPALGSPNWIPVAITFNNTHGTQYAYVADNGTGTPGHVYRCALNNDGSFLNSSCVQTPANDSSLIDWYPYYIAFQMQHGMTYAYIVNSSGSSIGNIYRCELNSSDLLENCLMTPNPPPSPWQPSGIAFY